MIIRQILDGHVDCQMCLHVASKKTKVCTRSYKHLITGSYDIVLMKISDLPGHRDNQADELIAWAGLIALSSIFKVVLYSPPFYLGLLHH